MDRSIVKCLVIQLLLLMYSNYHTSNSCSRSSGRPLLTKFYYGFSNYTGAVQLKRRYLLQYVVVVYYMCSV